MTDSHTSATLTASLYLLALAWYLTKFIWSLAHRTQIYYAITFFCLLRFVSSIIRIVLDARETPADILVATNDILIYSGFVFLLYPAYILILEQEIFTQATTCAPSPSPLLNALRIRSLFCLALFIGATLRIIATPHIHADSDHHWTPEIIRVLDNVSTGIFMSLAGIIVLLAIDLNRSYFALFCSVEPLIHPAYLSSNSVIALLLSVFLFLRQLHVTISPYSPSPSLPPQTQLSIPEQTLYTTLAMLELMAVAIFSLIQPKSLDSE